VVVVDGNPAEDIACARCKGSSTETLSLGRLTEGGPLSSLWRHPAFLKPWTASAISDIGFAGVGARPAVIAALMLDATAWQMGLLSAAESAPTLLVGLFAGVWVDRVRRRSVMITADLGRAALLLIVPLASGLGVLRIELLYAVALSAGALTVLFDVSHLSYLPSLSTVIDWWRAIKLE
jgi:hypothetical protein